MKSYLWNTNLCPGKQEELRFGATVQPCATETSPSGFRGLQAPPTSAVHSLHRRPLRGGGLGPTAQWRGRTIALHKADLSSILGMP